jgi:hypothetical protein
MNERIKELAVEAFESIDYPYKQEINMPDILMEKFAELLIEATLDQVKERAYYTGDRDWSDEVDRPWIQLEFGYGALAK